MNKKLTQTKCVLNHLLLTGSITSMEAFEMYGATRLSAIIFNLRHSGYDIISEKESTINRFDRKVHYVKYRMRGLKDGNTSN